MTVNITGKDRLNTTSQPALPFAPVQYSREYQDKLNSLLRLYFTQVDSYVNAVLDSQGARYLSAPYGAFQDTTTQTITANTATAMKLNTVDFANGISIVSGTKITVEHAGIYNLQWSGQFQNTNNTIEDINVWLRQDGLSAGIDVPGSKGVISIPARKSASAGEEAHEIYGWNYFVKLEAGEFVELWWSAPSTTVSLNAFPATTTPVVTPSAASLIVTMSYVSRL